MKNKKIFITFITCLLYFNSNIAFAQELNLANFAMRMGEQSPYLVAALKYIMYGIGVLFVATGLTDSMKASKAQFSGQISPTRVFTRILIGGALVGGGWLLDVLSIGSLTGQTWKTFSIYENVQSTDQFTPFMLAVIRVLQFYGAYSAFKGVLLWKAAGDGRDAAGGDKVASGVVHIVFGACLMNFIEFFTAVANFFNFPIPAFFPQSKLI